MTHDELCRIMHRYLARIASAHSAFRNAGADGMSVVARTFLNAIDLGTIPVKKDDFSHWLEVKTIELKDLFPVGGNHWGSARKALNIFLRHACYNCFMRAKFRLERIEPLLEVPLDSIVVGRLKDARPESGLPRWLGVIHLDLETSCRYQAIAADVAMENGIARVHLDPLFLGEEGEAKKFKEALEMVHKRFGRAMKKLAE